MVIVRGTCHVYLFVCSSSFMVWSLLQTFFIPLIVNHNVRARASPRVRVSMCNDDSGDLPL